MSQDELASRSRVGISTIRDYEGGRRHATAMSIEAMTEALHVSGVVFTFGDKDVGPGVCLAGDDIELVRAPKKVNFDDDTLSFDVRWRGTDYRVFLPAEILEDLDEAPHGFSIASEYIGSFGRNKNRILAQALRAIHASRMDDRNRIRLRSRDFFPRPSGK
jgi:transcriptional regulator with XRE-family HTH domain